MHWGIVGTQGESKTISSSLFSNYKNKVQKELESFIENGYAEIDNDNHAILLVEYLVDGMGTEHDVAKRRALQDKLQELLGWTGLGFCDGGSIGSGTMEACCYVVDFEIAKRLIVENLKGTEFQDYSKIFEEKNT